MPTILHQMLSLKAPKDAATKEALMKAESICKDANLFLGKNNQYVPLDADDKDIPALDNVQVQHRVSDIIVELSKVLTDALNVNLTVASGNNIASAPIMIDGKSIVNDNDGNPVKFPVTFLLELEGLLERKLIPFAKAIPTLGESRTWTFDDQINVWKSDPVSGMRNAKKPQVLVKFAPTKEHPGQSEVYYADVPIGTWTRQLLSGAIPTAKKVELITRLQQLYEAVSAARHAANSTQVDQQHAAETLMKFAFAPVLKS